MYLVGGGTHPGSGLPVIFESARISSRLLLEDFGMKADWKHSAAVGATENLEHRNDRHTEETPA